jgi:hypothetical protein
MAILIETWEVIWQVNKKKKKRTYEPKWLASVYNRSATSDMPYFTVFNETYI